MFDLADENEEKIRGEWYAPIGEYVLLFSNLEFALTSWIRLLSTSRATRKIENTLIFSRRLELLTDLIEEYQVDEISKNTWLNEWEKVKPLMATRNLICHNPPFNNFSLDKNGFSLKPSTVEIMVLKKPVGEPGSGLTLSKLNKQIQELRRLLVRLNKLEDEDIFRHYHNSR